MFSKDPEKQAEKDAEREAGTPVGQARAAFDRGDLMFQVRLDATAIFANAAKPGERSQINEILNAIVSVGWHLAHFSVVYSPTRWVSLMKNFEAQGHRTMYEYVFERHQETR